jgi:BirA family transcriptional regulator, biotin operon repressor / biotin---[acetyl-CoA-carboxylase] ligase
VSGPRTHWEGEPVRVWEGVWGVSEVEAWTSLPSTNDRARERGRLGAGPWYVVLADEQTQGRGRSGRRWSSPAGLGLWMSFLVRRHQAGEGLLTPLLAGLATARAVERLVGREAGVKWPNDVWIEGRKVAGVLCESVGGLVVVGVGVNVRQTLEDFPVEIRRSATSLELVTGCRVSRSRLAGEILAEARRLLDRPVPRLAPALVGELHQRDVLGGRFLRVGGRRGIGAGVDALGRLLVETGPGDVRPVVAGHVDLDEWVG